MMAPKAASSSPPPETAIALAQRRLAFARAGGRKAIGARHPVRSWTATSCLVFCFPLSALVPQLRLGAALSPLLGGCTDTGAGPCASRPRPRSRGRGRSQKTKANLGEFDPWRCFVCARVLCVGAPMCGGLHACASGCARGRLRKRLVLFCDSATRSRGRCGGSTPRNAARPLQWPPRQQKDGATPSGVRTPIGSPANALAEVRCGVTFAGLESAARCEH